MAKQRSYIEHRLLHEPSGQEVRVHRYNGGVLRPASGFVVQQWQKHRPDVVAALDGRPSSFRKQETFIMPPEE